MKKTWGWLALMGLATAARASIVVDGRLDEAEWNQAQVFDDFVITQPYTLAQPSYPTQVRLIGTPQGIAVGFRVTQPASVERLRAKTARDADNIGDRVKVKPGYSRNFLVPYGKAVPATAANIAEFEQRRARCAELDLVALGIDVRVRDLPYFDAVGDAAEPLGIAFDGPLMVQFDRRDAAGEIVVQADDDTWIIRLPAKRYLEASEERLKEADYTLPAFYERVFRSKPSVDDKMTFQAERIADYTINGCL